ncbi:MAG TPA: class II fructose-bisphosphatase, partial [Polyangiaceae bacterium]
MDTHGLEYAFVRSTEAAAIAAGRLVGLGDKNAVDGAAVEAMRTALSDAALAGVVVIGEGEKDEAPMLYHGEEIGNGDGPSLDVAVDPIDGTTLASRGGPGAISVIAAAPRGTLFRTRVPYMDKLVTGPAGRGIVSIDVPLEENLRALARAKGREVSDLTVALLDRPRNEHLMRHVRAAGARVRVFGDGDVANSVYAVLEERANVDVLAGIGGSPEGVIAACAVRALGGEMQGRLWPRDEADEAIAAGEGHDIHKTLTLDDLCASENALFAATGVTDGEFLDGVRYRRGSAFTQSIVISTYT